WIGPMISSPAGGAMGAMARGGERVGWGVAEVGPAGSWRASANAAILVSASYAFARAWAASVCACAAFVSAAWTRASAASASGLVAGGGESGPGVWAQSEAAAISAAAKANTGNRGLGWCDMRRGGK